MPAQEFDPITGEETSSSATKANPGPSVKNEETAPEVGGGSTENSLCEMKKDPTKIAPTLPPAEITQKDKPAANLQKFDVVRTEFGEGVVLKSDDSAIKVKYDYGVCFVSPQRAEPLAEGDMSTDAKELRDYTKEAHISDRFPIGSAVRTKWGEGEVISVNQTQMQVQHVRGVLFCDPWGVTPLPHRVIVQKPMELRTFSFQELPSLALVLEFFDLPTMLDLTAAVPKKAKSICLEYLIQTGTLPYEGMPYRSCAVNSGIFGTFRQKWGDQKVACVDSRLKPQVKLLQDLAVLGSLTKMPTREISLQMHTPVNLGGEHLPDQGAEENNPEDDLEDKVIPPDFKEEEEVEAKMPESGLHAGADDVKDEKEEAKNSEAVKAAKVEAPKPAEAVAKEDEVVQKEEPKAVELKVEKVEVKAEEAPKMDEPVVTKPVPLEPAASSPEPAPAPVEIVKKAPVPKPAEAVSILPPKKKEAKEPKVADEKSTDSKNEEKEEEVQPKVSMEALKKAEITPVEKKSIIPAPKSPGMGGGDMPLDGVDAPELSSDPKELVAVPNEPSNNLPESSAEPAAPVQASEPTAPVKASEPAPVQASESAALVQVNEVVAPDQVSELAAALVHASLSTAPVPTGPPVPASSVLPGGPPSGPPPAQVSKSAAPTGPPALAPPLPGGTSTGLPTGPPVAPPVSVAPVKPPVKKKPKVKKPKKKQEKNEYKKAWSSGVGFGSSHTGDTTRWNVRDFVKKAKEAEKQVHAIFLEVSKQLGTDKYVNEYIQESCLVPALVHYCQNDSFSDISQKHQLYTGVFSVLLKMLEFPQISMPLLFEQHQTTLAKCICKVGLQAEGVVAVEAKTKSSDREKADPVSELAKLIKQTFDALRTKVDSFINIIQISQFMVRDNTTGNDLLDKLMKLREDMEQGFHQPVAISMDASSDDYEAVLRGLVFDSCERIKDIGPHYYARSRSNMKRKLMKRLAAEYADLPTSLPIHYDSCVLFRFCEESMSHAQMLIIPPYETPYGGGLFVFDVFFPDRYPSVPPKVNLATTGGGSVRFNPNLYNSGKVCLSILGTWSAGSQGEGWNAGLSTFLQVAISIQSLVFVPEPYYNEPGYERNMGTEYGDKMSRKYNDVIQRGTTAWAMIDMLKNPRPLWKDVIEAHFRMQGDRALSNVKSWLGENHSETHKLSQLLEDLHGKGSL